MGFTPFLLKVAMNIGYIRVSTDDQDLQNQRQAILEFASAQKFFIDRWIEVKISSRKSKSERKIDMLFDELKENDRLVVTEISRLGRNMIETLNIINELGESGVRIDFTLQPELSTSNETFRKLMLAIYGYFAEAERDFISQRTKAGLKAARESGKQLGRPAGSVSRNNKLLPYRDKIEEYLKMNLSTTAIMKLVNTESGMNLTYNSYAYFIKNHLSE